LYNSHKNLHQITQYLKLKYRFFSLTSSYLLTVGIESYCSTWYHTQTH